MMGMRWTSKILLLGKMKCKMISFVVVVVIECVCVFFFQKTFVVLLCDEWTSFLVN